MGKTSIKLFVSYVGTVRMIREDRQVWGSEIIVTQHRLTSEDAIMAVSEYLQRRHGFDRLSIIFWRRLEE